MAELLRRRCHFTRRDAGCRSQRSLKAYRCRRVNVACGDSFSPASFAETVKRQREKGVLPSLDLDQVQAVELQMQVLKANNTPYRDHGIEVLYRFSNFDPFKRSLYFGRPLDLGQYERFRRIFHTPQYEVLLCHSDHQLLSSLKVSEVRCKQRVRVKGVRPNCSGFFTFSMVQRVGGHFDGIWFCESLIPDEPLDIHT